MLSKLKNHLLKKDIAAHNPHRKRKICSLKTAKLIGIIAEITDEDSYKNIFSFIRQLQQYGIKVFLLGYVHYKSIPFFCLKQLSAEYFCKKELNFYGKPDSPRLKGLLHESFDMLIDFTSEKHNPISYILQVTHAQFTVGANHHHHNLYDLFLDVGKKHTIQELSQIIDHYTNKLTNKQ
ncbi:MAG: hypothetical protein LBK03_03585 [Bacteroidales bacterium]|jgi:hypothetical protein|nr:hypothetical protein [Bacteroidales bacterium]